LVEMKRNNELINEDGTSGVKLVYIDPPFATKHEFSGAKDERAYQDKVLGAEYLEFLRKRLIMIREVLAPGGAVFVHMDWKKGHYVKVLLDEIFGEARFRNEIIWWYYNKMQGNVTRFPSNHETLFYYTAAGDPFTFNPQYEEREGGTVRLLKRVWDGKTGRLVNAKGRDGKAIYLETDEKRIDDVWRLSMLQPADKTESTGYPTQKPETLLALIVAAASKPGDIVLDAFAGSGTTPAVAEKLGRRWVAIDCGKLAIYTIQKRMLHLRSNIGNDGPALVAKPFRLYNAGLYDFSTLKTLQWKDWRFFALQLFGCRDEPHVIGGLQLDGKLKGSSVLVFNHHDHPGKRIDEDTVRDIHLAIGKQIGKRFFIVAPRGVFDFQQDYIDIDGVRYYALRIPYSVINELHARSFTALRQPKDEGAINDTVDAVGFDFIKPPDVKWKTGLTKNKSGSAAILKVKSFDSTTRVRGEDVAGGMETFAMLMLDFDYDGDVFEMDEFRLAQDLQDADWELRVAPDAIGSQVMAVFIDIYGNESRVVIPREAFGLPKLKLAGKRASTKKHVALA
ncbi:MAG TPA: site-specific DNA-methyltransferase, partial [Blastocatellia bacterium]|nr:site-specific DNA-methyltransferase [Blastocatellia bacterium]